MSSAAKTMANRERGYIRSGDQCSATVWNSFALANLSQKVEVPQNLRTFTTEKHTRKNEGPRLTSACIPAKVPAKTCQLLACHRLGDGAVPFFHGSRKQVPHITRLYRVKETSRHVPPGAEGMGSSDSHTPTSLHAFGWNEILNLTVQLWSNYVPAACETQRQETRHPPKPPARQGTWCTRPLGWIGPRSWRPGSIHGQFDLKARGSAPQSAVHSPRPGASHCREPRSSLCSHTLLRRPVKS